MNNLFIFIILCLCSHSHTLSLASSHNPNSSLSFSVAMLTLSQQDASLAFSFQNLCMNLPFSYASRVTNATSINTLPMLLLVVKTSIIFDIQHLSPFDLLCQTNRNNRKYNSLRITTQRRG